MRQIGMMRKVIIFLMAVSLVILAGCGKVPEQKQAAATGSSGKIVAKLAHNLPVTHHLARAMEDFAKKVNEKSQGNIQINIYPSGQLFNDKSMNDAVMTGGVEMGLNSAAMWSSVIPAMEIFDVPFLFPSYDRIKKAIDSGVGEKLSGEMEKKGARVLMWADYGFVQFANSKRPLTQPEDFKGLKLRGYGELPSETIKALGASPVTMGAGEVYMALQRGTIDGQTSGTTAMYDRKMYEVSKYLTVTNHAFPEFLVAINLKFWNSLTADQKKIIQEAADEVRDSIRAQTQNEDIKTLQALKEKGMEVYVVPESDIPVWQKATEPVQAIFVKRAGAVGQEVIDICKSVK
ncbi:C4-dicarboxylate-binding periplasmic protein DctP [Sporomusa carbonis]|uniref:TRAP transporter substrate-binding protein n=1 Tax=Sporomusa carbonis TaxID=3076075 RepID=UPI003A647B8C